MQLRRRGHQAVLEELEQLEPDLLEYALEQLGSVHKLVLDGELSPRLARRLVRQTEELALALITSLRAAHLRLWQDEHAPDGAEGEDENEGATTDPPRPPPSPPSTEPPPEEDG
jgi:hypothetical protein